LEAKKDSRIQGAEGSRIYLTEPQNIEQEIMNIEVKKSDPCSGLFLAFSLKAGK